MRLLGLHRRFSFLTRRWAGERDGAAMFEFALALPILVLIIAGGWEFARGLWMYETLNKGVRDAARYLARVDDPNSAAAVTMAQRLVLSGDIDTQQPPRIDYNLVNITVGTKTFDNSAGTYRGPGGGTEDIDVVRVRADMTFNAPLLAFLNIASPLTISVMHEERHIGD